MRRSSQCRLLPAHPSISRHSSSSSGRYLPRGVEAVVGRLQQRPTADGAIGQMIGDLKAMRLPGHRRHEPRGTRAAATRCQGPSSGAALRLIYGGSSWPTQSVDTRWMDEDMEIRQTRKEHLPIEYLILDVNMQFVPKRVVNAKSISAVSKLLMKPATTPLNKEQLLHSLLK